MLLQINDRDLHEAWMIAQSLKGDERRKLTMQLVARLMYADVPNARHIASGLEQPFRGQAWVMIADIVRDPETIRQAQAEAADEDQRIYAKALERRLISAGDGIGVILDGYDDRLLRSAIANRLSRRGTILQPHDPVIEETVSDRVRNLMLRDKEREAEARALSRMIEDPFERALAHLYLFDPRQLVLVAKLSAI